MVEISDEFHVQAIGSGFDDKQLCFSEKKLFAWNKESWRLVAFGDSHEQLGTGKLEWPIHFAWPHGERWIIGTRDRLFYIDEPHLLLFKSTNEAIRSVAFSNLSFAVATRSKVYSGLFERLESISVAVPAIKQVSTLGIDRYLVLAEDTVDFLLPFSRDTRGLFWDRRLVSQPSTISIASSTNGQWTALFGIVGDGKLDRIFCIMLRGSLDVAWAHTCVVGESREITKFPNPRVFCCNCGSLASIIFFPGTQFNFTEKTCSITHSPDAWSSFKAAYGNRILRERRGMLEVWEHSPRFCKNNAVAPRNNTPFEHPLSAVADWSNVDALTLRDWCDGDDPVDIARRKVTEELKNSQISPQEAFDRLLRLSQAEQK